MKCDPWPEVKLLPFTISWVVPSNEKSVNENKWETNPVMPDWSPGGDGQLILDEPMG